MHIQIKIISVLLCLLLSVPAYAFDIGYNGLPASITGNQTINATLGAEKVTNGDMSSACGTGFTCGANWIISGGVASKSAGASNNLSQDTTEAAGEVYKVTYTVSSLSAGGLTMSIGGQQGRYITASGTYTEYITATGTGDLTFIPSAAAVVVSLDNVSVVLITNGDLSVAMDITSRGKTVSNSYTVNILDFGGVPDGTTDNASALQNALNSILNTGGTVVIPDGLWKFTSVVVIDQTNANRSVVIRITGTGNTRIQIRFPSYAATYGWSFNNVWHLIIENMSFIRTSAASHDNVFSYIKVTGADTHLFELKNVIVKGTFPAASMFRLEDAALVRVSNSQFLGIAEEHSLTTYGVFLLINTHLTVFENNVFYDLYYDDDGALQPPAVYYYPRYWICVYDATSYSNGSITGMELILRNNIFDELVSTAQINLSPTAGAIEYVLIENNIFNYAQDNAAVVKPSIYAYGTDNPSVKRLEVKGNKWAWVNASKPVDITKTTYALIEGNNMPSPGLGVFATNTVTKLHVVNNTINGGVTSSALQTIVQPSATIGLDYSSGSTAPVLSACGNSPTLATGSNDFKGTFTMGATGTGCVVTFGTAKTNAPSCIVTAQTSTNLTSYTLANTAITVVGLPGIFNYDCNGINE